MSQRGHGRPVLICSQLRVRQISRAERFYGILGLRRVGKYAMGDGQQLVWLRCPRTGQIVELYYVPRGSRFFEPPPPRGRFETPLLFSVSNSDALLRRLRKFGTRVRADFVEEGVRIRFATDPDGNLVELLSWADGSPHAPEEVPLIQLVRTPPARTSVSKSGRVPSGGRRPPGRPPKSLHA